ncbi:MAG TPA: GNAT family N-acetyltransferase [Chloroflexaceae bacterium]|nr:GNAT family N-acetyltransferase [Chloroflexaceae bacterium]
MPLSPPTLAAIARHWADFFGCRVADLEAPGVHILPHAELEEYRGLFCLRRGAATLVSAPPDQLDRWRGRLARLGADPLAGAAAVALRLGVVPAQVIGPAALAYADATALRPLPTAGTRLLTTLDEEAHATLAAACGPEEWVHGGSELGLLPLAGRFARGELVALAGYEPWGERIAHIAVITHPAHRGRGYGAEAVSLLAETVIARGMIAQYRTLVANTPSLRLGASLGFAPFAETLAIRLAP